VQSPGTWTSADVAARAASFRGAAGHLATITSFNENQVVGSLRGANNDLRGWIGLTDAAVEGTFQWVTGEPFGFSAWNVANGEPNAQTPDEDYVEIFAAKVWNDIPDVNGVNQGYVVEYPVDPRALVDSPPAAPFGGQGDRVDRGFYHPSYPGRVLSTVRLWLSADSSDTYTVTMTARSGSYGGPVLGTATTQFGLTGNAAPAEVDFDFTPAAVPPGSIVTFTMTQVSPAPAANKFVFYHVGTCDASASCPTPSPFKETEGSTPPLDTFRRNGASARIFDTRPLPPPIQ
jgi:hypothetical protein